jgi:hypothetical protein
MRGFQSQNSFNDFVRSVKTELRFVRTSRQENFLKTVLATSHCRTTKLQQGFPLWRAQLGHNWRNRPVTGLDSRGKTVNGVTKERCAYTPERMKPCPDKAGDNRANPRGIACLYMATLEKTAILEVRPLIGSYVSVARLRVSRDIEIIDCTKDHFDWMDTTIVKLSRKEKLEENKKMVWGEINRAFSQPSQRGDESVDYVPTQILEEMFKAKGFDGIAYRSSFGENGFNIALFNLCDADIISPVRFCRVDDIDVKLTPEENL